MSDRLAEIEARLDAQERGWMIAHAESDLRDLLAVAKAARDALESWDDDSLDWDGMDALRDALTDLDRLVNERTAP